jgi:hypothetical protein
MQLPLYIAAFPIRESANSLSVSGPDHGYRARVCLDGNVIALPKRFRLVRSDQ